MSEVIPIVNEDNMNNQQEQQNENQGVSSDPQIDNKSEVRQINEESNEDQAVIELNDENKQIVNENQDSNERQQEQIDEQENNKDNGEVEASQSQLINEQKGDDIEQEENISKDIINNFSNNLQDNNDQSINYDNLKPSQVNNFIENNEPNENKSEVHENVSQSLHEVNEKLRQFISQEKTNINDSRASARKEENNQHPSQLSNKKEEINHENEIINQEQEDQTEQKLIKKNSSLKNIQEDNEQSIEEKVDIFDTEEKRIMIEQLNERLQQLNIKIKQAHTDKDVTLVEQIQANKSNYSKWIELQKENCIKSEQLENDDIKERAYELLVSYHSEIILLQQQKQADDDEIKRLKQIINSSEQQNKMLTLKIEDLEGQLRAQMKLISHRDNIISRQFEQAYNPEEISSELDSIKIKQAKSSYSFNNINNMIESNSFIGQIESPSPTKKMSDNYITQPINKKESIEEDTYTSFNISPSTKKKPIVIKKLKDSFYNNKKRLSVRKEQDLLENQNNIDIIDEQNGHQQKIQNGQPHKIVIQLNGRKKSNLMVQQDQTKSPPPPAIAQQHGIIRNRQQRTNSHRGNSFLDGNQNDPFWGQNHRDNDILKVNNKIKHIINEQKSFTINQSNSLWINSIDLGDLETQNELNQSKQTHISKEDKIPLPYQQQQQQNQLQQSSEMPYQPKVQKSLQKISAISNQKQHPLEDNKIKLEKKPSQERNINPRARKSYSIHSSTNIKLDPIQSSRQIVNNK